jgi:hypothetical protein
MRVPCYLVIDPDRSDTREYIKVEAIAGTGLDVQVITNRGIRGSTGDKAHPHTIGSKVRAVAVSQWLEDIFSDIETLETWGADHLAAANPHPLYLLDATAIATYLNKLTGGTVAGDLTIAADLAVTGESNLPIVRLTTPPDEHEKDKAVNVEYLELSQDSQDKALMRYAINVYADEATRDAVLSVSSNDPHDGMMAFTENGQVLWVYTNGAWERVSYDHHPFHGHAPIYSNHAARDVELVNPLQGQMAYVQDVDRLYVYTDRWSATGPRWLDVLGQAGLDRRGLVRLTDTVGVGTGLDASTGYGASPKAVDGVRTALDTRLTALEIKVPPTIPTVPAIEMGSVSVKAGGGASYISRDEAVTFPTAFASMPKIIISPSSVSASPGGDQRNVTYTVKAKTITGFDIVGEQTDHAQAWPAGGVDFDWIAMVT